MATLFILLPKSCTLYVPTVSTSETFEIALSQMSQCPEQATIYSWPGRHTKNVLSQMSQLSQPSQSTRCCSRQARHSKMYCHKCPMSHVPTGIANVSLSSLPDNIRITIVTIVTIVPCRKKLISFFTSDGVPIVPIVSCPNRTHSQVLV